LVDTNAGLLFFATKENFEKFLSAVRVKLDQCFTLLSLPRKTGTVISHTSVRGDPLASSTGKRNCGSQSGLDQKKSIEQARGSLFCRVKIFRCKCVRRSTDTQYTKHKVFNETDSHRCRCFFRVAFYYDNSELKREPTAVELYLEKDTVIQH